MLVYGKIHRFACFTCGFASSSSQRNARAGGGVRAEHANSPALAFRLSCARVCFFTSNTSTTCVNVCFTWISHRSNKWRGLVADARRRVVLFFWVCVCSHARACVCLSLCLSFSHVYAKPSFVNHRHTIGQQLATIPHAQFVVHSVVVGARQSVVSTRRGG